MLKPGAALISGLLAMVALSATGLLAAGCWQCLGEGGNGVPLPGEDEFQLVFNNIVSRESDLYVNNVKVGTCCSETEMITVGNFTASTQTVIYIHSLISDDRCYDSPCCSSNCEGQQCFGEPYIDTTSFAGGVYSTGLIWRY